jgi:hypothetical protein
VLRIKLFFGREDYLNVYTTSRKNKSTPREYENTRYSFGFFSRMMYDMSDALIDTVMHEKKLDKFQYEEKLL